MHCPPIGGAYFPVHAAKPLRCWFRCSIVHFKLWCLRVKIIHAVSSHRVAGWTTVKTYVSSRGSIKAIFETAFKPAYPPAWTMCQQFSVSSDLGLFLPPMRTKSCRSHEDEDGSIQCYRRSNPLLLIANIRPGPCTAAKRSPATNVKWSTKNPNSAWLLAQWEGP